MQADLGGLRVSECHYCQGFFPGQSFLHLLSQQGRMCDSCTDVTSQVSTDCENFEDVNFEEVLIPGDFPLREKQYAFDSLQEVYPGRGLYYYILQVLLDAGEPTPPQLPRFQSTTIM